MLQKVEVRRRRDRTFLAAPCGTDWELMATEGLESMVLVQIATLQLAALKLTVLQLTAQLMSEHDRNLSFELKK